FDDDLKICARRLPGAPRVMAHLNLVNAHPKAVGLRQDLGVYHGADGPDLGSVEDGTLENLKRAIDIPYLHPEEHANKRSPAPRIDQPVWRGAAVCPVVAAN